MLSNWDSLVAQTVKHLPAMWGDLGLIPGLGRSLGEGNGYPFQYSCLENSNGRGSWWSTVHGVTRSQTWLATERTQNISDFFRQSKLSLFRFLYTTHACSMCSISFYWDYLFMSPTSLIYGELLMSRLFLIHFFTPNTYRHTWHVPEIWETLSVYFWTFHYSTSWGVCSWSVQW